MKQAIATVVLTFVLWIIGVKMSWCLNLFGSHLLNGVVIGFVSLMIVAGLSGAVAWLEFEMRMPVINWRVGGVIADTNEDGESLYEAIGEDETGGVYEGTAKFINGELDEIEY